MNRICKVRGSRLLCVLLPRAGRQLKWHDSLEGRWWISPAWAAMSNILFAWFATGIIFKANVLNNRTARGSSCKSEAILRDCGADKSLFWKVFVFMCAPNDVLTQYDSRKITNFGVKIYSICYLFRPQKASLLRINSNLISFYCHRRNQYHYLTIMFRACLVFAAT